MGLFHQLLELIRNPGAALVWGYWGIALIVFVETGAMCFFLPGDSLLVVAGFYATQGTISVWLLNAILIPAAIAGPILSYWIGASVGPKLFSRPSSRFFKPEHIKAAHGFYERHGAAAIIISRFMPIVRTFVPIAAGIGRMPYKRYTVYNVVGAFAWVVSMTLIGYFLGTAFPSLIKRIEWVIVAVVLVSLLPGFISYLKARSARKAAG